jgi:hypothetical protein
MPRPSSSSSSPFDPRSSPAHGLRAPASEWHLEVAEGGWRLQPVSWARFSTSQVALQPGQPVISEGEIANPFDAQVPAIRVDVSPTSPVARSEPVLTVRGVALHVPVEVPVGHSLSIGPGRSAMLLDSNWNPLRTIEIATAPPELPSGVSRAEFSSLVASAAAAQCEVSFEFRGPAEPAVPTEE